MSREVLADCRSRLIQAEASETPADRERRHSLCPPVVARKV